MAEIPTPYAVALRLNERGAEDDVIASALEIPVESVPQLLEIGRSKLAALLSEEPTKTR